MYTKNINEKLLDVSGQYLFPDAKFQSNFMKGEYHDEYFVKRDYLVRLARPEDIDALMEIEAECWAPPVQTSRLDMEERLVNPACFNFVVEYKGKVVGVNYTQRINGRNIKKIRANTVHKFRDLKGSTIQLIALNILPLYQDNGWGHELLEFVLQYFSLHREINNVYAVTRCRDFYKSNCSTLQEYFVHIHRDGELNDPILKFHQYHGAKILGLIDNYRPNDRENHGYGVLIQYKIADRPWNGKFSTKVSNKQEESSGRLLLDLLEKKLNSSNLNEQESLIELGLDSLDSADILIFMHEKLGVDISMRELNNKKLFELLQLCDGDEEKEVLEVKQKPLKKRVRALIRQFPELVPLSLEGEGPSTFWIHPLSGDVGIYNLIAGQADGAFKMLAIKARGFLSQENKPFTSVIEIAKYYCEIIKAVDPEGPYHLAGFSFGGTIGYEMARQLQMEGKKVETLLLVESPFISGRDSELFKTTYRNNLLMNANFLLLTLMNREQTISLDSAAGVVDESFYQIGDEDVKDVADADLVKYIVNFCKNKGLKQGEEELEFKLLSMSDVHIANLKAIQEYKAEGILRPEEIKVRHFRTESANAVSTTVWNPDYLESIQRVKGSLLPLLEEWEVIFPQLKTVILEGDNHFDILHSHSTIKAFYDLCSDIFTNRTKVCGQTAYSITGNSSPLATPAIAVVGMSGRFPDAENVSEFWENLKSGRNSVREMPGDRGWDINDYFDPAPKTPGKTYSKWGGFLKDIDKFDPLFFKMSPREAEFIDPSERIFIQEAWKAIEDAGYNPADISGKPWGVFACAKGDYPITLQEQVESYYMPTDSYSAARLSYLLNLVGPAMSIDTACSSTMSVVVEACNSLTLGNCEAAIVGGGAVYTTPRLLIASSQSLLFSPDGLCYTFDQRANGTVIAEAVGAVVLKRLDKAIEDNDHIYGVIRGWGMNQDGKTNGITAPSGRAQSRLQKGVYEKFEINPEHITMFEAHGTGTKLGDAIEYQALTETFRQFTKKRGYCALGSLKTNIGHAFFGSGITGLIKILLSLKNGQIPPTLNFESPDSKMDIDKSPFYVNTALKEWQRENGLPRCAAINSFGATGTNAHLVVEEYIPQQKEIITLKSSELSPAIIVLSARDEDRLKEYVLGFIDVLEKEVYSDDELAQIAYTLQVGRESMAYRLALAVTSIKELKERLNNYISQRESCTDIYVGRVKGRESGQPLLTNGLKREEIGKLLELWVKGRAIDWKGLYSENRPIKLSLPTYPFAKERCWVEIKQETSKKESGELMLFTEDWEEEPLEGGGVNELKTVICFLSNEDNQKVLTAQLKKSHPQAKVVFIAEGEAYSKESPERYSIFSGDKKTYEEAFRNILKDHNKISAVLYLWPYEAPQSIENYRSIVYLLQALAGEKVEAERLILGGQYKSGLEKSYLESWVGFERSLGPMVSKTRVKVVILEHDGGAGSVLSANHSDMLWRETAVAGKLESVLYKNSQRYEYKMCEAGVEPGEVTLKTEGTYLITGGLGKLGLIFAKHLTKYRANIVLTGRSKLNGERRLLIEELERLGSRVIYIEADICDKKGMQKGIESARREFGEIHGVFHAAGTVEHRGIFDKELESFEKVVNPKVRGTLIVDELLGESSLDFICYFSSAAAILGDFGSCDYAVGNRFLMSYSRYRNSLEEQNALLGKTFVINWPVWRDGGMHLEGDDNENYLKASGQRYLETEEGLSIFENILAQSKTQFLVIAGQKSMVHRFLKLKGEQEQKGRVVIPSSSEPLKEGAPEIEDYIIEEYIEKELKEMISLLHNLPVERLDAEEHLMEYGFDSINLFDFAGKIDEAYGVDITPSSLLGYSTIAKITEYLVMDHKEALVRYYSKKIEQDNPGAFASASRKVEVTEHDKKQSTGLNITGHAEKMSEPIAIIGMSGRFPQADSVDELWQNLRDKKEAITEVPGERWNWRDYYGDPHDEPGKSNSKWGGFMTDIARFDPLFFKISPKEAHIMDPCQRIFLEEAWHALEDAGYMGDSIKGCSCGVYVGIEEGEYGFMARQAGHFYSNQNAVLSARIAYALDLKGPNLSITASCSSGLVALHQACQAIVNGDCEMALAGGVNLLVSSGVHVGMSQLDLLSPTGKSYVFDNRADGLVPAEAVGVVVLKPLSQAIRDNDRIYGTIKGSGVNYNGKGHGMMAPNPVRQAELINQTFDRSGGELSDIDYIISHSVGAKLGDAAEVEGLKRAFSKAGKGEPYCYIGSIKSLIGHTFAASGVVSLITMLLAMKNKTVLGLHNYEDSNENIDFSKTPFIASGENRRWEGRGNRPRLGAISTAANSGTNAFALIEEYVEPRGQLRESEDCAAEKLFVFSAVDEERLQIVVKDMLEFIELNENVSLSNVAYTLQMGREAMSGRVAIQARTRDELISAIKSYLAADKSSSVFSGNLDDSRAESKSRSAIKYEEAMVEGFVKDRNLEMVATHWCRGGKVNWQSLYDENVKGRRISLPGYPFREDYYWISAPEDVNSDKKVSDYEPVEPVKEYILNFFAERLEIGRELIMPDRYIQDYGADSILLMRFIREFEKEYKIRITGRELLEYPTIEALTTYLSSKVDSFDSSKVREEGKLQSAGEEYQDPKIIEAMERYIQGEIELTDLEKSIEGIK